MVNALKYKDQVAIALCKEAKEAYEDFCANHVCIDCPANWPGPCVIAWLALVMTKDGKVSNRLNLGGQAHEEPHTQTHDEMTDWDENMVVVYDNLGDSLN